MPITGPIHNDIPTTELNDRTILLKWNTAMRDIATRGIQGEISIRPEVANLYKYDFYGLLTHLGIDKKFHYPYLVINGLDNPTLYLGNSTTILGIDTGILQTYYDAFFRK